MELIEGSETSAYINQTPGKHPKEYIIDVIMLLCVVDKKSETRRSSIMPKK